MDLPEEVWVSTEQVKNHGGAIFFFQSVLMSFLFSVLLGFAEYPGTGE